MLVYKALTVQEAVSHKILASRYIDHRIMGDTWAGICHPAGPLNAHQGRTGQVILCVQTPKDNSGLRHAFKSDYPVLGGQSMWMWMWMWIKFKGQNKYCRGFVADRLPFASPR